MIAILDANIGNLRSVFNAVDTMGYDAEIVTHVKQSDKHSYLIIPGVGSVVNEKGQDITYRLKNGERFFTPQKELENALPNCDIIFWETEYDCSGPSYGAIM